MTMRRVSRTVAAGAIVAAVVMLTSSATFADPSGSKNSFSFPASCSTGQNVQDLQAVVNSGNGHGQGTQNNPKGQANFSPAHVAGSNQIFHPTKPS